MRIRPIEERDFPDWRRMSDALLPDESAADYEPEMRALLARDDAAIFVAERPDGSVCGYVEAGTRAYADGCRTSPVGYIEAWYVYPDVRRRGYGRALLAAAEAWARDKGLAEMASDALLDNTVSYDAHIRSGYSEVERVVKFRKDIPPEA
ncbi:MAG TPA: GNAT family N-acetyltransferase [Gemmatimonadaceae bacterium]|nr:GNAT family N-acetyltransferase [Gemmatimonadaceae bacterium]